MLRQIYRVKRDLFSRLYPTIMVFKDGSTIKMRHHEPSLVIRQPLTLEDCTDAQSKKDWTIRRRAVVAEAIKHDDEEITFDARKYLRQRKR